MITITICQRKGGNGKSTAALNLSCVFAEIGKRVLLIDLDDQKNTTSAIAAEIAEEKTIDRLLLDEHTSVKDMALSTAWKNVDLIASSASLSGIIRELDGEVGSHAVLAEKLEPCKDYDLCIIDTSPSLNILVVSALCASDYLFIPLSSKYFSLKGLEQTLEAFGKVQKRLNPSLSILGMAFVIHDGRSSLAKEVMMTAKKEYGRLVCDAFVSQNIKIEEAQTEQKSIIQYASKDKGSVQYRALAEELLERMKGLHP
jgi:chromosome partitioning protein